MSEQISMEKALELYAKHVEYMKTYNKRPEVREKRREYNSKRWQAMKLAKQLLAQEGKL